MYLPHALIGITPLKDKKHLVISCCLLTDFLPKGQQPTVKSTVASAG